VAVAAAAAVAVAAAAVAADRAEKTAPLRSHPLVPAGGLGRAARAALIPRVGNLHLQNGPNPLSGLVRAYARVDGCHEIIVV
jgi:hypothetical protein